MDGVRTTNTTKYCGTRIPPTFISKSNLLTLKLVADESLAGRGFKANYSFVNIGKWHVSHAGFHFVRCYLTLIGCGGILKDPHQLIKPPVNTELNDGSYQHNANCEWTIFAPAGYLIYLSWISFQLEQTSDCVYDFVEIYDNGTKIGRFEWKRLVCLTVKYVRRFGVSISNQLFSNNLEDIYNVLCTIKHSVQVNPNVGCYLWGFICRHLLKQ